MSLNSDQDPWAKPGQSEPKKPEQNQPSGNPDSQHQSPPDIEEVFNNLLKKLGGKGNANHSSGSSPQPSMKIGKLLPIAALIGAILWGVSGLYTVGEAERGVVTRFGKLHSIVQPGLNWKPTFIDDVKAVNVEQVKELRTQGAMLTKDENMVKVEMSVQYRVHEPAKFLFNVTNPEDSLNQATDSALRYVIGHKLMDEILTTGRAVVREETWKALNDIIKPYDMGLEVIDVNFQSARPPEEVKEAFDDAIKAQEDEQRYIREAEAYAREKEPIARGDAQRTIEEATAYKEQIVLNAKGEVERFQRLLPEFKIAPDLLRERLYIQTMENIMAKTPKVLLDNANGNNVTLLPLEQLLRNKKPAQTSVTAAPTQAIPTNNLPKPVLNNEGRNEQPAPIRQGRFN